MIFIRKQLQLMLVTDLRLVCMLGVILIAEFTMLLALVLGHPTHVQLRRHSGTDDIYRCWSDEETNDDALVQLYLPVTISARVALILVTAIFVFRIRNIPDTFNESKQVSCLHEWQWPSPVNAHLTRSLHGVVILSPFCSFS
jgi:hypothetical protein